MKVFKHQQNVPEKWKNSFANDRRIMFWNRCIGEWIGWAICGIHWSSMAACDVWLYHSKIALGRKRRHILLSRSAGTGEGLRGVCIFLCTHATRGSGFRSFNNTWNKKKSKNKIPYTIMTYSVIKSTISTGSFAIFLHEVLHMRSFNHIFCLCEPQPTSIMT